MTMGIALLGALMTHHATQTLARAVNETGLENAAIIARQAVAHHAFSTASDAIRGLYTHAMESGFQLAMLCSSASCIVALALIARLATHEHQ
jgi:MFS transporter, DHA2 family, methylenomycin A resistance protein